MTKVYIITEGSYSDYHIVAAVKTEKLGKEVIAKLNGPGEKTWQQYTLEEHELITSTDQCFRNHIYSVGVDMDGTEIRRFDYDSSGLGEDPNIEDAVDYFPTYSPYTTYGNPKDKNCKGMVQAISPRGYEVALKAARDKLAQIKAETLL